MLAAKRVLVFGGTGLLGRHLASTLTSRGAEVSVASRHAPAQAGAARWVRCDMRDEDQVAAAYRAARPECVVHLAAALQMACEAEPELVVGTNLCGTDAILRGAAAYSCARVIFASSLAVYGEGQGLLDESQAPGASPSLYGCAKWFEEILGARYARLHRFRFTALRYSAIFGRGEVSSAGMARVRQRIESARLGAPVSIAEAGGHEKAQLTYVGDAVDATLAVMSAGELHHTVYNVAGPRENYLSLLDYHAALKALFPGMADVAFTGQARSAGKLSTDRLTRDTGFMPSIRVAEGLRLMYGDDLPAH